MTILRIIAIAVLLLTWKAIIRETASLWRFYRAHRAFQRALESMRSAKTASEFELHNDQCEAAIATMKKEIK